VLQEISRKKPNAKNRGDLAMKKVGGLCHRLPGYGQVRVSNELKKRGLFVSPTEALDLDEPDTFKKRLAVWRYCI
jgi:hypothetical protein